MPTPDSMNLSPALSALLESVAESDPVSTKEFAFEIDGTSFAGFVARPSGDATRLRPAVLVVHDWTGLNDTTRVRAQMLARLGYIALAGDVYGDGASFTQDEAPAQAGRFYGDPTLFRSRVTANLTHLRSIAGVDPDRIAVIGYCFGGSAALELARSGAQVAGIVTFHGGLGTGAPAEAGSIRSPLLVLTGTADPVVPDDAVVGFENELRAAGADDWQVVSYSGAMHAFTIPDANAPEFGAAWDARADRRSWTAMRDFFDEIFA